MLPSRPVLPAVDGSRPTAIYRLKGTPQQPFQGSLPSIDIGMTAPGVEALPTGYNFAILPGADAASYAPGITYSFVVAVDFLHILNPDSLPATFTM